MANSIEIEEISEVERRILYDVVVSITHNDKTFQGSFIADVSENGFGESLDRDVDLIAEDDETEQYLTFLNEEDYENLKTAVCKLIAQREFSVEV